MAKLNDLIAKTMKDVQAEITAGVSDAMAKSVGTTAPKAAGTFGGTSVASNLTPEQARLAEAGFIAKQLRGGVLRDSDTKDLSARGKAIGVTADFGEVLPSGFTGTLLRDIQAELNVAKLFMMKTVNGGTSYDLIALNGVVAYLTAEATTGTESSEAYKQFMPTAQKIFATVRKSYELLEDSLIDIAMEVRTGIVRAIAEAVETTVVNGDLAGTMDAGTAANSAIKVSNGLRYTGLNKATVDFGGAAYTEDTFLGFINDMQLAGGVYLDEREVAKGNVVLIVDQHTYANIRKFTSYKTMEVAGRMATLFGGKVNTIFDIPLVVTSQLPAVNATGVVDAIGANNTLSTCILANIETCQLSVIGNVIAESDKDITNQTFVYTGSLRYGFSSKYDSTPAAPNTVTTAQINVVAGINMAR